MKLILESIILDKIVLRIDNLDSYVIRIQLKSHRIFRLTSPFIRIQIFLIVVIEDGTNEFKRKERSITV